MADEVKITEHTPPTEPATPAPAAPSVPHPGGFATRRGRRGSGSRGGAGGRGGERGARRSGGSREERTRPEFDSKTLNVRRVARVVAGGRRFNFSVLIVLGNRKGSVGVGTGKAGDTAAAIEKATRNGRRNLIRVERTKNNSIPHIVTAKYSSARIVVRPAPNKGLIAGSAARAVLELGGITDVNAKILSGSKNKLNIARATIKALTLLKSQIPSTKSQTNPNNQNQNSGTLNIGIS